MFTLEIEMGNEAMLTRRDVAEALRAAADKLLVDDQDGFEHDEAGMICDVNGNYVGDWNVDLA